jgi:hypothetical protein
MLKNKKREIVCPRTDCYFYSFEHAQVDEEWIPITFCSHPQNELILNGKSCNLYRMDWAKQMQKLKRTHPADRVKLERQAMLKLLQSGIGNLSPDERDAALGLVEQLKQQEERLDKLSEVLKDIDETSNHDPFVIPDPEPPPAETPAPEPLPEPIIEETPEPPMAARVVEPEPPEETPEDCIRCFIESWNRQKFDDEYDCLADRLRATPQKEYVRARHYAYADAMKFGKNGSLPTQELGAILSVKIEGDTARVICEKIEKYGRFPKTYQQKYILVKKDGAWKISNVQTREK